jgi:hypothetical protein
MQLNLFENVEAPTISEESKMDAGKRVIKQLLDVRRKLKTDNEQQFVTQINYLLKQIRSETTHSDAKSEQLILHSVEKSHAGSFEEISEDTRIAVEVVKQIVSRLEAENILGISYRGKSRMSELTFSKRCLELRKDIVS